MRNFSFFRLSLGGWLLVLSCGLVQAQTSSFTYQGKLTDGGSPASGPYQMQFSLHSAASGDGNQIGSTITLDSVPVTNGTFTVELNFTAANAFDGSARWLQIAVRKSSDPSFVSLNPRQPVTSTPYSIKSLNATLANNSSQLGGVAANQYVVTTDARMTDARTPTAGSANYIQNNPGLPQSGSFNISGIGELRSSAVGHTPSLTLHNTSTHGRRYRIASFADASSGFFAIRHDTLGYDLLRIEDEGGVSGTERVVLPVTGLAHSTNTRAFAFNFLDRASSGISAEAFGELINFGANTGREGAFNSSKPGFWLRADTRSGATGFQFFKKAASSGAESLLMRIDESGNVGIGTTSPAAKLEIAGGADFNGADDPKAIALSFRDGGYRHWIRTRHNQAGAFPGNAIDFFVNNSAFLNGSSGPGTGNVHVMTLDSGNVGIGNVGIGIMSPEQKLHVHGNEILTTGASAGFKFRNRGSTSSADDWVWYSSGNLARFFRNGTGDLLTVSTTGVVQLFGLGTAGGTPLCFNPSNQISLCSSSIRYKHNIHSFGSGLDLINRLRPVTFNWKADNQADVGLVAEEVAAVEPLLATYNKNGEIEGVKYDRVGIVLINAVKEQQAQIESQQKQIDALKKLVCEIKPNAEICEAKDQ